MDEQYDELTPPLFTGEDLQQPVDTSVGNYQTIKAISTLATGNTDVPDEVNYDDFVDEKFRQIVPENNMADYDSAKVAAANNNVPVVQQALSDIAVRTNAVNVPANSSPEVAKYKTQQITNTALEKFVASNYLVVTNNTPKEVATKTNQLSTQLTNQAVLEKLEVDGFTMAKGIAFALTPFEPLGGLALDNAAVHFGVPKNSLSLGTGRSKAIEGLSLVFQTKTQEEQPKFALDLLNYLKDSYFISDMYAASIVADVISGSGVENAELFDALDKIGGVATVLGGLLATAKAGKLISSARSLRNAERIIAAAGGKGKIEQAEAVNLANKMARQNELRAAGTVIGEATGVSVVIDMAKLVTMSAAKVLPDAVTTPAINLQKVIREPVERLIGDLQTTIAGKGIRSAEAATQLEELTRTYAKAENPNIHTVDPFTLSADATEIVGRVVYKPADASAFLTKEAAEAYAKSIPGSKVIPDTTNNGFLVEAKVKEDLIAKRDLLAKQLLAETLSAQKSAVAVTKPAILSAPVTDAAGNTIDFEDDLDKATYLLVKGTPTPKDYKEVKQYIKDTAGWADNRVKGHQEKVRTAVGKAASASKGAKQYTVASQVPTGRPLYERSVQIANDQHFQQLTANKDVTTVGNISIGKNLPAQTLLEFTQRMGKLLGMTDRKIVILYNDDIVKSTDPAFQLLSKSNAQVGNYNALHYDYGNNQSVIVLKRIQDDVKLIEDFAHEYGHAFMAHFQSKYHMEVMDAFTSWATARKLNFTIDTASGTKINLVDAFGPRAMLEYRSLTHMKGGVDTWIKRYLAGDVEAYKRQEKSFHSWASSYEEFFSENFTKWAFTDEIPTTVLGQVFKQLVDGFKVIAAYVTEQLAAMGFPAARTAPDENIARLLNTHTKLVEQNAVTYKTTLLPKAVPSAPSASRVAEELAAVEDELKAIEEAETGLRTGWLVEKPVISKIDYSAIGKYSDDDIDSFTRFAFGD